MRAIDPGHEGPDDQSRQGGEAGLHAEQSGGVCADAVEGGVAEGELAGLTQDDDDGDGEDGEEPAGGHDPHGVAALVEQRPDQKDDDEQGLEQERPAVRARRTCPAAGVEVSGRSIRPHPPLEG